MQGPACVSAGRGAEHLSPPVPLDDSRSISGPRFCHVSISWRPAPHVRLSQGASIVNQSYDNNPARLFAYSRHIARLCGVAATAEGTVAQSEGIFRCPFRCRCLFHLQGMLLEQRSGRDTPKSSFFSFVFTNVDGRRTYTACLTFYEPMRPSAARHDFQPACLRLELVVYIVRGLVRSIQLQCMTYRVCALNFFVMLDRVSTQECCPFFDEADD